MRGMEVENSGHEYFDLEGSMPISCQKFQGNRVKPHAWIKPHPLFGKFQGFISFCILFNVRVKIYPNFYLFPKLNTQQLIQQSILNQKYKQKGKNYVCISINILLRGAVIKLSGGWVPIYKGVG